MPVQAKIMFFWKHLVQDFPLPESILSLFYSIERVKFWWILVGDTNGNKYIRSFLLQLV